MSKIFCISGLGADEQIFSNLHVPGFEMVYVKWIRPLPNEPVGKYTSRLIAQITETNPILLGVSFGGMICIEVSHIIPVKQIIIISSIKSRTEMPLWMRLVSRLRLHKLITIKPYNFLDGIENNNLGVRNEAEKAMVRKYRKNIDLHYLKWSINAILNWDNTVGAKNIFHLHGDKDKIFPVKNIRYCKIIKGGGHLMVHNMSDVINPIIQECLAVM